MSGPKHLPLIAWSKQELISARDQYERALGAIDKENARRGDRDEKRHGFEVPIHATQGTISCGYAHYATPALAYDAAVAAATTPAEKEVAPYRVHPVYLGKDDEVQS